MSAFWKTMDDYILSPALPSRVSVLRALAKYLKQTGFTFSQTYIEQTLGENPVIARKLVELFDARFNPEVCQDRVTGQKEIVASIREALDSVANADEDRILRRFLSVIQAVVRTNFYQHRLIGDSGRQRKPYISFKEENKKVADLTRNEIWVMIPLVLLMFWLGFNSGPILKQIDASSVRILEGIPGAGVHGAHSEAPKQGKELKAPLAYHQKH